ncbi:MAG: hypothetical protein WCI89_03040 [bacterium]
MAEEKLQKQILDLNKSLSGFIPFVKKQFENQEKLFEIVIADIQGVKEEIQDIKDGQVMQDKRLDDIDVVLRGVLRAVDKDSVRVVNHERRITKLERAG